MDFARRGQTAQGGLRANSTLEAAIVHEFGHLVHYSLSSANKEAIDRFYANTLATLGSDIIVARQSFLMRFSGGGIKDLGSVPSVYGLMDAEEFFAESFVNLYYLGSTHKGTGSKATAFINDQITRP